jgi:hypothetical protein
VVMNACMIHYLDFEFASLCSNKDNASIDQMVSFGKLKDKLRL